MTLVKESIATLTLSVFATTVIIGIPTIVLYALCCVANNVLDLLTF
jgi:hypothetical protein